MAAASIPHLNPAINELANCDGPIPPIIIKQSRGGKSEQCRGAMFYRFLPMAARGPIKPAEGAARISPADISWGLLIGWKFAGKFHENLLSALLIGMGRRGSEWESSVSGTHGTIGPALTSP